ncbi:hypothetical protein IWZ00DRAFT_489023 [Phyllosticta capitalensis]|uniref:uncharacterized protein n=1 Tax=Phyllosticta capitalensis TaxID=121624 RepID=UPI0031301718
MTSISVHQKAVCGSGPVLLESSSPTAQAYGTLLSGPARQGPDYAPLVSSGPVPSTTPPNQSILFLAPKTTTPPRGQAGPDRVQASCWCSRNGWESEQQRMHMGANGRPSSCLPLTTVNIHELTCLAAMMVVVSTAAFWRWHRRYLPVRLVAAGWRDSASKPASQPAVDMVAWQRERRETSGKTFSLPLLLCEPRPDQPHSHHPARAPPPPRATPLLEPPVLSSVCAWLAPIGAVPRDRAAATQLDCG